VRFSDKQCEALRCVQEDEAARKAAEEEERLAAEREQRKAERAARRADAKRQGLLLTGKAKKEAERLTMLREQLLRNSGVALAGASPSRATFSPAQVLLTTLHVMTSACRDPTIPV
jgi:hypothetical protein